MAPQFPKIQLNLELYIPTSYHMHGLLAQCNQILPNAWLFICKSLNHNLNWEFLKMYIIFDAERKRKKLTDLAYTVRD